jgi:hypothetical protein
MQKFAKVKRGLLDGNRRWYRNLQGVTPALSALTLLLFIAGSCSGHEEPTATAEQAVTEQQLGSNADIGPALVTTPVVPADFAGTIETSLPLTDAEKAATKAANDLVLKRNPRNEDRSRRGFGRRDEVVGTGSGSGQGSAL